MIVYSLYEMTEYPLPNVEKVQFSQVGNFLGIAVVSFECIGVAYPIRNSMADPRKFVTVFSFCTLIVTLCYTLYPLLAVLGKLLLYFCP